MNEMSLAAETASALFQYGVLGIFCVFLIFCLVMLWRHLQKKEDASRLERERFMSVTESYVKNDAEQTRLMDDMKDIITNIFNRLNSSK